jgi:hypothetical protein
MTATDLLEVLVLLGLGFGVCVLPVLVVGVFAVSTVIKLNQQTAHVKVAQALGFTPLNAESDKRHVWYGGAHLGRRVAINAYSRTYRYYYEGRSRRSFSVYLRVAMAVQLPGPQGLIVYREPTTRDIPNTFEDAFQLENAAMLPPGARQTMLAFVYLGYPTGFKPDLTWRFTRGTRNLRLGDRASAPADLLPPAVLADEHVILVHDHPDAHIAPDGLRALLNEMAAVAEAVETGQPSRALELPAEPPKEGAGKYAPWALAGFVVLGLPTIVCFCGMILAYLNP